MSRELCFKIEKNNLFLSAVLVDYQDIPIFFLCDDGYDYYAVLCYDPDELRYIVVRVLHSDIYKLLKGSLPMRNIFLSQDEYWDIESAEDVCQDKVKKEGTEKLPRTFLPKENAHFKILTEPVQKFANSFFAKFEAARSFEEFEKDVAATNEYLAEEVLRKTYEITLPPVVKEDNSSYSVCEILSETSEGVFQYSVNQLIKGVDEPEHLSLSNDAETNVAA